MRLLLKLVQDYEEDLGRAQSSMAGILGVLDDVRSGLERFYAPAGRKKAELRRCNTDLRRSGEPSTAGVRVGKDRRPPETATEENQRLRKELSASLTARKSLEKMFSSLGKEKEIMAGELARKAQELHDIEEHLNDLKAQNEMLLEKVKLCATEHKEKKSRGGGDAAAAACEQSLLDRNKTLSEQLLRALDGYRALKRKVKDLQEEKAEVQEKLAEMAARVSKGLYHIREFCRRVATGMGKAPAEDNDVEVDISSIENLLRGMLANISSAVAGRGRNMEFPQAVAVADVPAGSTKPSAVA